MPLPAVNTPIPGSDQDVLINEAGNLGRRVIGPIDKGTVSSAVTINWHDGWWQVITLTNSTTCVITATNAVAGGNYLLTVKQSAGGTGLITWPSGTKWPSGTAVTLSTSGNAVDIISFRYDGSSYFAIWTKDFS